jgi:hypothetical protein
MINHAEDAFTMRFTSMYTLTDSKEYASVAECVPVDSIADTESPFIMGRTFLVLSVVELIIGLGVYRFIS